MRLRRLSCTLTAVCVIIGVIRLLHTCFLCYWYVDWYAIGDVLTRVHDGTMSTQGYHKYAQMIASLQVLEGEACCLSVVVSNPLFPLAS